MCFFIYFKFYDVFVNKLDIVAILIILALFICHQQHCYIPLFAEMKKANSEMNITLLAASVVCCEM